MIHTAWKVSKYGVISGPYFPVFGPEITPYLDTFRAVSLPNFGKNKSWSYDLKKSLGFLWMNFYAGEINQNKRSYWLEIEVSRIKSATPIVR